MKREKAQWRGSTWPDLASLSLSLSFSLSLSLLVLRSYEADVKREKAQFATASARISGLQPKIDSKTW